ncbi:1054_t:CDS:2 [Funneliformis caledonium]|uniref:1054_t:CDS:1 n=1 Tax=Funneliformis caledonium TaxID=1117310 RepID=A0A9N9CW90_9GLOM|nr:1054_t:CDS:2 [Funneliformis caledonium]
MIQRKKQVSKPSTSKATNTKSKVTNTRATQRTRKAKISDFEDISQVQEISDNDYVFVQDKVPNMQQNESDDDLESTLISLLSKKKTKGVDLKHALELLLSKEKARKDHDQNGNDHDSTDRSLLNEKEHHHQNLDSIDRSLLNRKEYSYPDLSIRSTNESYYEDDQSDLNFRWLPTKRLSKGLNIEENDYLRKLSNNLTTKTYNLKTYSRGIINNQLQSNKFKSRQEIIILDQTQLNRSNKHHYDSDREDV